MASALTLGKAVLQMVLDQDSFKRGLIDADALVKKTSTSMGTALGALGDIAGKFVRAGEIAFAGFAAATVKVGADFEQAMATLGAIANEQPGSEGFTALEAQARKLGQTTLFSAKQAAEGLTELEKAGLSTAQAITASDAVIRLAGAHQLELARSAEIVAAALTQFQLPAEEAGRVTDVLSTAANASLASVDSLAEGLKFAAPITKGFGTDIEQTTTLLAAFSNIGIQAYIAGRSLRSGLVTLTEQTKKQREALAAAGLTFQQVNPEVNDLKTIFQNLAKSQLTTIEATRIFGTEAGGAFALLADSIRKGKLSLDDLDKKIRESGGSTQKLYQTMLGTLESQTRITFNKIQDLMITAFGAVAQPLKELVSHVGDLIDKVKPLVEAELPKLRDEFGAFVTVVEKFIDADLVAKVIEFTKAVLPLATALAQVLGFLGKLEYTITGLKAIFELIIPTVGALAADLQGVADAFKNTPLESLQKIGLFNPATEKNSTTLGGVQAKGTASDEAANFAALKVSLDAHTAEARELSARIAGLHYSQEELAWNTVELDKKHLAELEAQIPVLERQVEIQGVLVDKARLTEVARSADLGARPRATDLNGESKTTPDLSSDDSDRLINKARSTFDALQKEAQSAAEALAKATMTPIELLVFETNAHEQEIEKDYERAVQAARDAGQSTEGIEVEHDRALISLSKNFDAQKKKLEQEATAQSAKSAVDVQDKTLSAYESGLTEREQLIQAEALANAHAGIEQQRNSIDLQSKLSALTTHQVAERTQAEQTAAAESERIEADRDAKVLVARRNLSAQESQIEIEASNRAFDVEDAQLSAFIADAANHRKRAATAFVAIDRKYEIDKGRLLNEEKKAIEEVQRSQVLTEEEKQQAITAIDAEYTARRETLDADRTAAKKATNDQLEQEIGGLGKVFDVLNDIGLVSDDVEKKWLSAIASIEKAFGAVKVVVKGIADVATAGIQKLSSVVETLTGFSTSLSDVISIASSSAGFTDTTVTPEQQAAGVVASRTVASTGSAAAATNAVTDKVDAALQFTQSLAANIGVVVDALVSKLPDIITAAANAIGPLIDALASHMGEIIQALADGMVQVAQALAEHAPDLIQAIVDNIGPLVTALIQAATTIVVSIVQQLPQIVDSIVQQLPAIITALVAAVAQIIDAVIRAIPGIAVALIQALPGIITAIVNAMPVLFTAFIDGLFGPGGLVDQIPAIIQALLTAIPQIVAGIIKAIPQIVVALVKAIPVIVVSLVKLLIIEIPVMLAKFFVQFWAGIWDGIDKALQAIGDFFAGVWQDVLDAFKTAGDYILEAITLGFANTSLDKSKSAKQQKADEKAQAQGFDSVADKNASLPHGKAATGRKVLTADEILQLHKDEAVIPAKANPYRPGTGKAIVESGLWDAVVDRVFGPKTATKAHARHLDELPFRGATGSYARGARVLPRTEIAEVHKNEAIIPADTNPYAKGERSKIIESGLWDAVTEAVLGFAAMPKARVAGMYAAGWPVVDTERIVRVHPGEAILPAYENPNNPGVMAGGTNPRSSGYHPPSVHAVHVLLDSQLVDGCLYTAGKQGRTPHLTKQLARARGTKLGLSKRKFSPY